MKKIKKILMVFGTRPEAIKMAPLYHKLKQQEKIFNTKVCVTGQHKEMLENVFETFDMQPDINLNLMQTNQDLFDLSSSALIAMRDVLIKEKPDIILVHGDTTTSNIAATAGFYLNIKIGHIEAGLRTNDIYSPFPEEFNRQLISMISTWHFAPTKTSMKNLIDEKYSKESIFVTGNTVIDALFWTINKIEENKDFKDKIIKRINQSIDFNWENEKFILITGHRRESFGDGFKNICKAIKELSEQNKDIHFIYPVHLNPNVNIPVHEALSNLDNVHLIEPMNYEDFVYLIKKSYLIITDSGGIQEEAPSLGKPVVVMRDTTERPEAVEAGTVMLSGNRTDSIIRCVSDLLKDKELYMKMSKSYNPYGNGDACTKIVDILKSI
tara:strand:+ start:15385 stop:16530 length:1146 start_codon:yes stop_codon:yes gene_type:complete